MEEVKLYCAGACLGRVALCPQGGRTEVRASMEDPGDGLYRASLVGERGTLSLGVLEPEGAQGHIRRRFSGRLTVPLGRLLRGEVRPAGAKEPENWEPAPAPEQLFRAPWLRQRLKGAQGAKVRLSGETRYLALPYDPAKPFPLTTLFCFARLRSIGGGAYIVFAFDRQDRPVF